MFERIGALVTWNNFIFLMGRVGSSRLKLAILVASIWFLACMELLGVSLLGVLLASIFTGEATTFWLTKLGLVSLSEIALLVAIFFLIKLVCSLGLGYLITSMIVGLSGALRVSLFNAMLYRELSGVAVRESGVDINALTNLVDNFYRVFNSLSRGSVDLLILLGLFGYFTWNAPEFFLTAFFVVAALAYVNYASVGRKVSQLGTELNKLNGSIISIARDSIAGIKEIRVYKVASHFLGLFSSQIRAQCSANSLQQFLASTPRITLEAVTVIIACVGVLGAQTTNILDSDMIGVAVVSVIRVFPSLVNVVNTVLVLRSASDGLSRLRAYFQRVQGCNQPAHQDRTATVPDKVGWDAIEFSNLVFSYGSNLVLNGFNLVIRRGEFLAIVGPSGSGKSTFLEILVGIQNCSGGTITIDGSCASAEALRQWRDEIAYLSQDGFLFAGTLAENIALCSSKEANLDLVSEALRRVGLEDLATDASHLPVEEAGINFSGGQRQRIALARVLYSGRTLIVLDEFTSSLDFKSEMEVCDVLEALKGCVTLVMVSHKRHPLTICDRVVHVSN